MIFNYFQSLFLDESARKTLDILEESNFENELEVMVNRRELDNLQEDISDDIIRPYVSQYVRNLMENLRNMSARARNEDVQVNQDDSFVSDRDYDEYTINDPDEEQDNLDDEVEDDEDEEDQGEEDEGPHFIVILVDVSIPVGLYTTFLSYTPKINVLKQPSKEKKLFNVLLYFLSSWKFCIRGARRKAKLTREFRIRYISFL